MIAVTTPTGRIGKQLVSRLLDRGSDVRVIARDSSRLSEEVASEVELVEGSHADPRVLDRALAGADALFWLVPPDSSAPSAMTHYLRFARAAADAVRRHDVGHVVSITSAGHGWTQPAGILSAAFAMDDELRATGAAFRALSLPFYMENLLGQASSIRTGGMFSLTCNPAEPLPTIATRDIAARAAELLTDLSWRGQSDLPLFGPDRLTPTQMAQTMSDALGRPISYRQMSTEDFAALLRSRGASEQAVEDTVAMFTAQADGIYDADWKKADVGPTDFRTWCSEVLAPAVAAG
ncbi:NmrA family NAD(P)-binding protein [Leifsonia sp. AG29]|uniref:NmrA family NAD(P)-binding protein n=1 Tax=Leifsonia sp. AG29 TaxID=2598860 RepID=UPI00131D1DFA|nr:NAD(P)H-binding protein [Leifsonia sp. AG29]